MGSNPFWPTYLASVHVLCVSVTGTSSELFTKVFDTLSTIREIKVSDIGGEHGAKNDLIAASEYKGGSILYDYTTAFGHSDIERFSLEPNSDPLIILGIIDVADKPIEEESTLEATLRALHTSVDEFKNEKVYSLLLLDGPGNFSFDNVISASSDEPDTLREAMITLSRSLLAKVKQLPAQLSDLILEDPRVSLSSQSREDQSGGRPRDSAQQTRRDDDDDDRTKNGNLSQHRPHENHKGRYTIVLGLLNLYVGAWPDAMRRLDEGATLAREVEDVLWQARALEALVLCMALLAWKGEAFNVPEVCLKAYSTSQMMSRSSTFPNPIDLGNSLGNSSGADLSPERKWAKYAPVIVRATMDLYSSLVSSSQSNVPVALLTESRIRLGNLLLFAQISGDTIDGLAFSALILDQRLQDAPTKIQRRTQPDPSLVNMMLIALSAPVDEVSDAHILSALTAVISSLSQLNSNRRYAFLFRGLLQKLVPILIRARKLGASEAGVHPAATLSSSNPDTLNHTRRQSGDLKAFLDTALTAYDVHLPRSRHENSDPPSSTDAIKENIRNWYLNQSEGDLALKLEMLQLCVSVSDALPDLRAYLDYSSYTLRLCLRTLTISMITSNARPSLPSAEQARLVEGVKRTALAAKRLGLDDLRADYWDEFFVRDIQIYQAPDAAKLSSHKPSELSVLEETKGETARDPFIFNPFAKAGSTETTPVVVAGELITFSVILQNPLETEIEVDEIILLAEGCDFVPSHHNIVLGPFWSQAFSLIGRAQSSGSLKVLGCRATVAGCHRRDFAILPQNWRAPGSMKLKATTKHRSSSSDATAELQVPDAKVLTIKVLEPQPRLVVATSNLPQPSLMLLEGETKSFELIIRNESQQVPTDLLLFTYQDNVSNELQEALGKKDLLSVDMYEVQYQLKRRPTIVMAPQDVAKSNAGSQPGESIPFQFELFGRPGLTSVAVQMDFAYLGIPRSEITQTFYTRQQRFPLAVTVNGSVDIIRCNILPLQGSFPWLAKSKMFANGNVPDFDIEDRFCMLSLDLRNIWPQTLSVQLTSALRLDTDDAALEDEDRYTVQEDLQPGHVSRVILLVPRAFIQEPFAPIPNLITQRQYVVSASKLSLEAEAASRETFWYREKLLQNISGTWKEPKTGRSGQIDFRKSIRLSPRTIDVLKIDHVNISFTVLPRRKSEQGLEDVKAVGKSHYSVPTESFVTLRVHIHNRSKSRLTLLLRLQPALRDQPHNVALDLSRRLAWSGVLQQALHPCLDPGETRDTSLDLVVFCEGHYEVNATVEEIKGRQRTSIPLGTDGVGVTSERRIWHARAPCFIDAFDSS